MEFFVMLKRIVLFVVKVCRAIKRVIKGMEYDQA